MDHGEVTVSIRVTVCSKVCVRFHLAEPRCRQGFACAIVYGQATTSGQDNIRLFFILRSNGLL